MLELLGFCMSMGILTGGVGINIAHELEHKTNNLDRKFAKVMLLYTSYMHFFIERTRSRGDPLSYENFELPISTRSH